LAKVLPELSGIASWIGLKDPTHTLRIERSTSNKGPSFVQLSIEDTASSKRHYIAFDTAHMVGTPARPQVKYHRGDVKSWSERDDNGNLYTLTTALAEIR
ncbi:MAG: hypothetical protein GYA24_05495, partial [Candidatus Lokiarchaeota archaeon]|nr:hypothetical protein [Candidatus Lokiarchaeota archaeon]